MDEYLHLISQSEKQSKRNRLRGFWARTKSYALLILAISFGLAILHTALF